MDFSSIIGQEDIKQRLISGVDSGKVVHAIMLCGPEGNGAMAIALAYARYLLCKSETKSGGKPCGQCPSCAMTEKLQHPDLHFAFPIYKLFGTSKPTYCDDFIKDWREMLLKSPHFGYREWTEACDAQNHQLQIYADESDSINRKLSLKSSQGGYKVVIVWLTEKMNEQCSNKLLKLLEEPPQNTVFILISEEPDKIIQTIRSRAQMISVPRLPIETVEQMLKEQHGILPAEAKRIARYTTGNMVAAQRAIRDNSEAEQHLELFISLMRLSYMRKVKEMKLWSEKVASLGRERQKGFLTYCQRMIRENFIYNFHTPDINYMSEGEADFAVKFAPFINERNVMGIMEELSLAQAHIEQNANPKMVLFDFSLKMIVLIKNR
jgi:DNA polymerase-3 subunit delta'